MINIDEILKIIKSSDASWADKRTQNLPRPGDFGDHLPISEDDVKQVPLELPLYDDRDLIKEELPQEDRAPLESRGVIIIDLLG